MPQYPVRLLRGLPGASNTEDVLGRPEHGGKGGRIPHTPLQIFQGVVIGSDLQHSCLHSDMALGPVLDSFGRVMQILMVLFYADGALLLSKRYERLQQYFDALMDLFDRVGIHINIQITVRIICQTCQFPWGHSSEAYDQHNIGEDQMYQSHQKRGVHCP